MPPTKKPTPAQWLDLLIEKAPLLREAGVLEIDLEGCAVTLAPVEPDLSHLMVAPTTNNEASMAQHMDALDDPDTYPNGQVAGYYDQRRQGPGSNDDPRTLDG